MISRMGKIMNPLELIQLPDDATAIGYRETRPFHHEQVFHSEGKNFTGTAKEFLDARHAYAYVQIDKFTRRITAGTPPTPRSSVTLPEDENDYQPPSP